MQKIITFTLILFLTSITWAGKVQVLSGVTPPPPPKKVENKVLIPAPQDLTEDDEMLPQSVILYVFEVCAIGGQEVWASPEQSQPLHRDSKTATNSHKIKKYQVERNCRDYIAADTYQDKQNMRYAALRELYVPNRKSYSIERKAIYGQRNAAIVVKGKIPEPYTVPYDEMVAGNVLKKILTDRAKIKYFYSFNLPASIFLGETMQKRKDNHLPIRISFYEEMLDNGLARNFMVFVFDNGEKYTYPDYNLGPNDTVTPSDTIYDIQPDKAVQYVKRNIQAI